MRKLILLYAFLILLMGLTAPLHAQWVPTNGPSGCFGLNMAVAAGTNFYIGSTYAGLFKSTDNGASWSEANNGLTSTEVYALASNGSVLFVGTVGGVFVSNDGASTWSPANTGLTNTNIRSLIAYTSGSTNYVLAGTAGGGVFRSTNNGSSWTAVNTGLSNLSPLTFARSTSGRVITGTSGGNFFTDNNGTNWYAANAGLTNTSIRAAVAVGTTFYIATGGGAFYSADGANWAAFSSGLTNTNVTGICAGGTYLYAATNGGGVFRASGATWTAINTGLPNVYAYKVAAIGNNLVMGFQIQGAYRSSNNGDSWADANQGLAATIGYYLCPTSGGLFASALVNGVFFTSDNGNTWLNRSSGLPDWYPPIYGPYVNIIAAAGPNLLAAPQVLSSGNQGVYRSTNNGVSWAASNTGLTNLNVYSFGTQGTSTFVGTSGGVWKSTDYGANWTASSFGMPATYVFALCTSDTTVFAGTAVGVYRSTNSGNNWSPTGAMYGPDTVYALVMAGTNLFAGTRRGVYRSTNLGTSWTAVNNSPLPTVEVRMLAAAGTNLFVGLQSPPKVYLTTNAGSTWTDETTGITSIYMATLAVSGQYLFEGGYAAVWRRDLGQMVTPSAPVLTTPANAATGQSTNVTLNWGASPWVSSYVVHVSTTSSFSPRFISDSTTVATSRTLTGLAPNTTYYWRVAGKNQRGVGPFSSPAFSFSTLATASITGTVTYPGAPVQSDYRMVGVPGAASVPVSDLTAGSGGAQTYDWRAFRDPGSGSLTELTSSDQLSVGEGVWLIRKNALTITKSATMPPLAANGTYSVTIHNGWNILANPFDQAVRWSAVRTQNSLTLSDVIQGYSGSYAVDTVMQPFKGYYFLNNNASRTTLAIPYPLPSTLQLPPYSIPEVAWTLRVAFETADNVDTDCRLGMAPAAAAGLDSLEIRKPPLAFAGGEIYFSRPDWDEKYSRFSTDYRPEVTGSEEWDLEISHPKGCTGTLRFSGVDEIPMKYRLVLISPDDGQPIDLRSQRECRVQTSATKLTVRVLIGLDPDVERRLRDLVPTSFALWQNFPNPFNPTTTLRYGLPVDSRVSLMIYNILGQVVATLVDDVQQAGYKEVSFGGKSLPSGVYIYRLQATSLDGSRPPYVAVKKMVLTK